MEVYQVYLLVGVALSILEIIVPGLILLPIGLSAILAGLSAYFTNSILVHAVVFSLATFASFYALSAWRKANATKKGSGKNFGPVGQIGLLIELSESRAAPGKVKVFGDTWDIHWPDHPDQKSAAWGLKINDPIKVTGVLGNKVSVEKI